MTLSKITGSPMLVRVVPFIVFIALTAAQGQFGEASRYWFYVAKTIVGVGMLLVIRPHIPEMRWALSWEAVVVGVGVFAVWVGLDGRYPSIGELPALVGLGSRHPTADTPLWNPLAFFAGNALVGWGIVVVRFFGTTLVVPPLEEVFFRSFIYRWIIDPEFEAVPFTRFGWKPLLVTSVLFAVEHNEWIPGMICGLAFQWLVIRKGRLGDAITAHSIANGLLGVWVLTQHAWKFW